MSKKFNDWLDEFVQQGADANDVSNWPENSSSGGSIGFKEGSKVIVDFSQYNYVVSHHGGTNVTVVFELHNVNDGGIVEYDSMITAAMVVEANEAENQLVAYFVVDGAYYQVLSNSVVIYEGDTSNVYNTSNLQDLPTVEFTMASDADGLVAVAGIEGVSVEY